MEAKAPALASRDIFHVNPSPLAFSLSNSLTFLGNAFRHSNIILGSNPLTTQPPKVIIEPKIYNELIFSWNQSTKYLFILKFSWNHFLPINSQPDWVLSLLNRLFWLADLNNSSPTLNTIFPRVWGMPRGVCLNGKICNYFLHGKHYFCIIVALFLNMENFAFPKNGILQTSYFFKCHIVQTKIKSYQLFAICSLNM